MAVPYRLLADLVLIVHAAIALFVIGGLVLVVVGNRLDWRWVNAVWFRLAHLSAIAAVAAESWFGVVCPLTSLEMWLRLQANDAVYAESFIAHWVHRLLYYEAPEWVFMLAYTVFAGLVVAAWWRHPPNFGRRQRDGER